MTGLSLALGILSFTFVFACSTSSPPVVKMPDAPEPMTKASLVGPLCNTERCTCTDDPVDLGEIPAGKKRFQITLGPSLSELWASIDGQTLYKGVEGATSCFTLDLSPGDHSLTFHAKGKGGFGGRLLIRELGTKGPWLFDSFEFNCGAPGLCDMQSLEDWKQRVAKVSSGKHAPCGSVRISGIDWINGRMPDNHHPETFFLEATMKVYTFVPRYAPGAAECSKE